MTSAVLHYQRHVSRKLPLPDRPEPLNCECCGKPFGDETPRLDHDHAHDRFRGWICNKCNSGIGFLGDTARSVAHAVMYLIQYENQFTDLQIDIDDGDSGDKSFKHETSKHSFGDLGICFPIC